MSNLNKSIQYKLHNKGLLNTIYQKKWELILFLFANAILGIFVHCQFGSVKIMIFEEVFFYYDFVNTKQIF